MQPPGWYINRLSLMTFGEIRWRIGRAIRDRVSSLLPIEPVPEPRLEAVVLESWPVPADVRAREFVEAAERILGGEAQLFGDWVSVGGDGIDWNRDPLGKITAPLIPGSRLDYRDSRLVGSARNTWELNRHFQLVMLAQAWAATENDRFRKGAADLLEGWLSACPYPLGINWTSALEHGIRLINWYLSARMLQAAPDRQLLSSIYRHCRFIWQFQSRHSSANNHLIGEMAGLYVASAAWHCWQSSARWRAESKRILMREAHAQVHSDGVSKEQSTGYQPFIIQFLLIAGLVGETTGDPFPRSYWEVVRGMLTFLASIRDESGNVPSFGDADEGIVFLLSPNGHSTLVGDLLELDSDWSGVSRDDFSQSAAKSWIVSGFPRPANWPTATIETRRSFPAGGYYVLGTSPMRGEEVKVVFDAGPLGFLSIAAHGHADCLSFTLSIDGQPVLIDPGTYTYHEDPVWRDYFRSTAAHNTVGVDDFDQSEMGGPFMWLQKAVATVERAEIGEGRQEIMASHDGYQRLSDPVVHRRRLVFDGEERCLEIVDEIEADADHLIRRFWHLSPVCAVRRRADSEVDIEIGDVRMRCSVDSGSSIEILEGSMEPRAGWYSPRFGELERTVTLRVSDSLQGSARLRTAFEWRKQVSVSGDHR